jgi:hypothetical protein
LTMMLRPSPDINQKIEESTNQSWVCLSPTFDFLSTIQTEIKKSKNRRIPNWSWSCDNRQMLEGVYAKTQSRYKSKNRRINESKLGLSVPHLWFPEHHPDRNQKIEESKNPKLKLKLWQQTDVRGSLSATESNLLLPPPLLIIVSLHSRANRIASKAAFSS